MALLSMEDFISEFNFHDHHDVKRLIEDGMPFRMDGKCYRFDADECREWFLRGWFDGLSKKEKCLKYKQFRGLVKEICDED